MIISIASGKGGTGKTTVATSLALALCNNVLLMDCDVEEPNAHIFIKPEITKKEQVYVTIPKVNEKLCNVCGKCAQICAYNALAVLKDRVLLYSELCHGCGACSYLCPQNAITEVNKEVGYIESGRKNSLDFIHGALNIGEVLATSIIREIKKRTNTDKLVIIDSPPGTTCPMVEAVKNSDYCILVTEPTPFGLHDLILAVEVLRKLTIPIGVIINRADISDQEVESYCANENIPVLLKIPFKKEIALAYSKGVPIIEALPEYREKFKNLLNSINEE